MNGLGNVKVRQDERRPRGGKLSSWNRLYLLACGSEFAAELFLVSTRKVLSKVSLV